MVNNNLGWNYDPSNYADNLLLKLMTQTAEEKAEEERKFTQLYYDELLARRLHRELNHPVPKTTHVVPPAPKPEIPKLKFYLPIDTVIDPVLNKAVEAAGFRTEWGSNSSWLVSYCTWNKESDAIEAAKKLEKCLVGTPLESYKEENAMVRCYSMIGTSSFGLAIDFYRYSNDPIKRDEGDNEKTVSMLLRTVEREYNYLCRKQHFESSVNSRLSSFPDLRFIRPWTQCKIEKNNNNEYCITIFDANPMLTPVISVGKSEVIKLKENEFKKLLDFLKIILFNINLFGTPQISHNSFDQNNNSAQVSQNLLAEFSPPSTFEPACIVPMHVDRDPQKFSPLSSGESKPNQASISDQTTLLSDGAKEDLRWKFNILEKRSAAYFASEMRYPFSEEDQFKNRYNNAVPTKDNMYNAGLVVNQKPLYFNGSKMKFARSPFTYIATQGPLGIVDVSGQIQTMGGMETIKDFLSVAAEGNSDVIVTLAMPGLYKEKTANWWEIAVDKPIKLHNNSTIQRLSGEEILPQNASQGTERLIKRRFQVTKLDKTTHIITQFMYENWPDGGIPKNYELYSQLQELMTNHSRIGSPIIVHCSAGIGRTGTLIATHSLNEEMKEQKEKWRFSEIHEKLYERVWDMRKLRGTDENCKSFMVQTEEQYVYAFNTLWRK